MPVAYAIHLLSKLTEVHPSELDDEMVSSATSWLRTLDDAKACFGLGGVCFCVFPLSDVSGVKLDGVKRGFKIDASRVQKCGNSKAS